MAKKEVLGLKGSDNLIGRTAFLVGFLLAIIAGAFNMIDNMWTWVLALIGILIGLLNVTEKETQPFLLSGVIMIIVSAFGMGIFGQSIPIFSKILSALLVIFVPTTLIVAVMNIYNIAKD